jgi:diketogulonate reductase-like aldo/keto reductase
MKPPGDPTLEPSSENPKTQSSLFQIPTCTATAWKAERTAGLVAAALRAGFRGIDTACQPKHYKEKGVGDAIAAVAADKDMSPPLTREDLFLQTKYTPMRGQDPNDVPYDPASSIPAQVARSFAVSRFNLRTDYVDSLVLHSPFDDHEETMLAWRAMEALYDSGGVRQLGIR